MDTLNGYRFSFNGKENDTEVEGDGNWQDYGARLYSSRLGRFPSPDPIIIYGKKYPELSSYQFASNMPINCVDLDGLEPFSKIDFAAGSAYALIKIATQQSILSTIIKSAGISEIEQQKLYQAMANSIGGIALDGVLSSPVLGIRELHTGRQRLPVAAAVLLGSIQGYFASQAFLKKYPNVVNDKNYIKNEESIAKYKSLLDDKRFTESDIENARQTINQYGEESEEGKEALNQKKTSENKLSGIDAELADKKVEAEKAQKQNQKALKGSLKIFKSLNSIKKQLAK